MRPADGQLAEDAAIARLARAVLDCSLPKAQWTHEAHFALALWLARERPDCLEPDAIRAVITRYNEATLTPNSDSAGYHHTITLASLRGARACLAQATPDAPLGRVLSGLMASPLGRSDWLLDYWSRAVLMSVEARRDWVEPDLAPLPF